MKIGTQLGVLGLQNRAAELRRLRQLGCDGVEVGLPVAQLVQSGRHEQLRARARELRSELDDAGLEVISLTPGFQLKDVTGPLVEAVVAAADLLRVSAIRMYFSPHVRWGGPHSVLSDAVREFDGTRSAREWRERDGASLQLAVDAARGSQVRWVFELHHGFWVNSASGAMRMLDRYQPDQVGVLMDPGNMVFEGNEGWRNSVQIMGPYLAYIHCKNAVWRRSEDRWVQAWAGLAEGIANYPELMTALKDEGFAGYLSVEDLRSELTGEQRVAEGAGYLRSLIASPQRVMPT